MPKGTNKIVAAIETAILSRVKSSSLFGEYYKRTESRVDYTRQATLYKAQEIKDWKLAIASATDPYFPRRGNLSRFYQSLKLDNHLSSVIDSRIMRVQRSSYKIVNDAGVENEELKKLLERPWFDDLVRFVVGKVFQGTTLIELFDLDEMGELSHVKEIPQTNFIAQTGQILNFEWDMDGTSYKEGIYADYYIQVGDDWELGMLNELAMIILAKKLGLGSWMSYIDKFGVPPVFVTTDRQDPTRTNELFEMLTNFRSNNFTILKGTEKVEIPNNYNSDAYQSFKALNEFADEQISKRVLGNTASTDKKAFVGAAEVQERVSQDRYEADKLLFKYFFNTQIRQRLAKLSSVYADFATHTIIYDNQETIAITDYIDGVQKLAQYFDFDTEEIKKRTGLPITGIKAVPNPINPPATDPQKKKSNASVAGANRLFYSPFARSTYNIFAATWDAATERLATHLYNGEIKPSDLDKDLVLKNYSSLSKSVEAAWGKDYYTDNITRQFRENLLQFSGAKSNDLMTRLDDLRSKTKDKESFIDEAKKMVALHNETYLNVEQKFAANSASTAKDFEQFVKDVDIYPCLTNRTIGDGNVRDTHAENEGVTKRVEDWIETPPYDPGCRCWLEQTTDEPTKNGLTGLDSKWANNPYTSGCIFTDKHSYFQNIPDDSRIQVHNNTEMCKLLVPSIPSEEYAERLLISPFAQFEELAINTNTANIILNNNPEIKMKIRPHLDINKMKNPEYTVNGLIADAKRIESWNVASSFKSAIEQECKVVIIDLVKQFDKGYMLNVNELTKNIRNRYADFTNDNINNCHVVWGSKSVIISKNTFKGISNKNIRELDAKIKSIITTLL